ncbi:MAG: hypothetical protein QM758_17700 [Armatimonas sp.]
MKKHSLWIFILSWLVAMGVLGYGGGIISERCGAPFFFGFFFGFTLTGLTALFLLAARIGDERARRGR